jgi:pimeloyl-ACP methyl ester carboxylesterase
MQNWTDIHYTSRDGLRLHARHYPSPGSQRRPLLCLPGLSRNCRDFHDLASALSLNRETGRDVYSIDYRGRGRSEADPDWKNYTILTELNDVLDFMALRGLHGACILGTSRGGLITMLMGVLRPTALGAVILNDVGPVIERDGLSRIIAYLGRMPIPNDWAEATRMVYGMHQKGFTSVPDEQWESVARQIFNDEHGLPAPAYDANLAKSVSMLDAPPPDLWPQFMSLARLPTLVLRGSNSDMLSAATLNEMRRRHSRLEAVTIRGQGHAPLLKDAASIATIAEFLARTDAEGHGAGALVA